MHCPYLAYDFTWCEGEKPEAFHLKPSRGVKNAVKKSRANGEAAWTLCMQPDAY